MYNEEVDVEIITITKEEYISLIEDRKFLDALHAAGVDNWDGYEIAQDMLDDQ